jgi:thiamine-monophosphate kinase
MLGEFELIDRYFKRTPRRAALGIGDDCALLDLAAGQRLAVSCDMLVEGRHFLSTVAPARLGHKALAVNLSDLAACGAEPLAFVLALALPRADEAFLEPFAQGLFALADAHGIELVGGDTTAGPLNLCITVFGQVPPDQALLRSGARPGHDLWVSGQLGDARLALEVFRGRVVLPGSAFEEVRARMECPTPRIALGLALRGLATSAIDLSDGLVGDIGHVMRRSGVGARVDVDALPRSAVLAAQPEALQRECLLAGGDDYELLFTTPPSRRDAVLAAAAGVSVPVTRCGSIEAGEALRLVDAQGRPVRPSCCATRRAGSRWVSAAACRRGRRAPSARCGPGSPFSCSTAGCSPANGRC